jgi:hypothetical protein
MTTQTDPIAIAERVALHQRMAESYRDAYGRHAVQEGDTYSEWTFAPDAVYSSPYFGSEVIELATHPISVRQSATMEALAYSVTFEGWGPADFASWASDHGFAMKTRFEGRRRSDGVVMGFFAYGFVETNASGEITSWQTHVSREYDDFLDVAIGLHGPFDGRADDYMEALGRTLANAGLTVTGPSQESGS